MGALLSSTLAGGVAAGSEVARVDVRSPEQVARVDDAVDLLDDGGLEDFPLDSATFGGVHLDPELGLVISVTASAVEGATLAEALNITIFRSTP